MSKVVLQTSISWRAVEAKWLDIKEVFRGFNPAKVSRLTTAEIDTLVRDKRVIRNGRKIEVIAGDNNGLLELDSQHGGFEKYPRSFGSYDALAKDLRKQFRFLGDMGICFSLWSVGEDVPSWEEWGSQHMAKIHATIKA